MTKPSWLVDIQSNAPTHIKAELSDVVTAQLAYYASVANYEAASDVGDDTDAEVINGLPHPDNAADALQSALHTLDAVDPGFCARYCAAEDAAELSRAAAASAQRPAWLAEIYAVAEAKAAEEIGRLRAAEHRMTSTEKAGDWDEWDAAERAYTALITEMSSEDGTAEVSLPAEASRVQTPEEAARQVRFDELRADRHAADMRLAEIGATEDDQIVTAICLFTPRNELTDSPFANRQLKRFTERQIAEIRASTETYAITGARFGLSKWQVGRIKRAIVTQGVCGRCRIQHAFLSDAKTLAKMRATERRRIGAGRAGRGQPHETSASRRAQLRLNRNN